MKNNEGVIYYQRGDLLEYINDHYGIVIDGNNLDDRHILAYIFGYGRKVLHDTRIKLISSHKG